MSDILIKAIYGEKIPQIPIWMMRQAGRYLPEYNQTKEKLADGKFWHMVKNPHIAKEITLQPVRRFNLDAAILFSDILTPLPAMGFDIDFIPHPTFRKTALEIGIQNLTIPKNLSTEVNFVAEAIKLIKKETNIPLIGFAGAPYTLACYALKNSIDKDFCNIRKLFYQDYDMFKELLDKLTAVVSEYLNMQIKAGVDVIMIFDSWTANLSIPQYENMAFPFAKKVFENLNYSNRLPKMYYSSNTEKFIAMIKLLDIDVVMADWRSDLSNIINELGNNLAISGNLDPAILFGNPNVLKQETLKILEKVKDHPRFIFNLGHGIYQKTPIENVAKLVETVQTYKL